MQRGYNFTIDQTIRTWDEDTGEQINGVVVDKNSESIMVQWDNRKEPEQIFNYDYGKISLRYVKHGKAK